MLWIFNSLRSRAPLQTYRQRYDRAITELRQAPNDQQLKQEALRLGRAFYLQKAGKKVGREEQYSIEDLIKREVDQAIRGSQ